MNWNSIIKFCDVATDCKLVIFDESDIYVYLKLLLYNFGMDSIS